MFRIRRTYDNTLEIDRQQIAQVQQILRAQFPLVPEKEILKLPDRLQNPIKYRFRSILFVADDNKKIVKGFALLLHDPDINFCYLDYISSAKALVGRGVGGALYERVREEARSLNVIGLFFECLPDTPELCRFPEVCRQNAFRLRFYERFGARPIIHTAYETPLKPGGDNPPYLVFDNLGRETPLRRDPARAVVRAILEGKYRAICPREYVEMVVSSFKDDPVRIREPKYIKKRPTPPVNDSIPSDKRIRLVVTDKHAIHHVKERGYVESPVRVRTILKELNPTNLFEREKAKHFSERYIRLVHDAKYVDYFRKVCENIDPSESVYPYVFPLRNVARPPKELAVRAGYYCIDTFTPLNRNAFWAAKGAVDCALTAAQSILEGTRLAYALVRPPGHHAERKAFGGFCYFNSTAISANFLSAHGSVALLDIDYHHGNGHQNIFYRRKDVLTISLHGHPRFAYPYFSGFEDEKGEGEGKDYNVNFPLPEDIDSKLYQALLEKALRLIKKYMPTFLVVSLGLDTAKGDPTGTWMLTAKDFEMNGHMIGAMRLPTLIVQEGGYNYRNLGINARHFFTGLWKGTFSNS